MTDAAVIQGTFSDLRTVKTRNCIQMIIEVPIEQGAQIVSAFGFPQPQDAVWVAVARLDPEKAKASPAAPEKPRVPFHDRPLSVQAALTCRNPKFWEFTKNKHGWISKNEDEAAGFVKTQCRISSRSDLDNTAYEWARQHWRDINAQFEKWAGYVAEER